MSDSDWEESVPSEPPLVQGRTFGMRGRGFKPVEKVVGLSKTKHFKNEGKENSSNGYGSNFGRKEVGSPGLEKKINDDGKGPKILYIPKEIEDEELFTGGISTGINFSKYDDIAVNVSGENVPKKIDSFESAGLHPILYANITKCLYKKLTPIQKYALPIIMNGRDLMACAQTGSGKTVAFLVPIIHCMLDRELAPITKGKAEPELLVVTPTRELAIQVYIEARKFTYGSNLKTEICYGGTSLRNQCDRVKEGCNILIATMGRLQDFIKRNIVSLKKMRHFVIDEADEMLDRMFLVDIEKIFSDETIDKENVQIVMFSATFPEIIQNVASKFLKNYLFLAVGIVGGACADVEQKFYDVPKSEKRSKLIELLKENGNGKTVVFVRQKRSADIIAAFLSEMGYPATSMHGDRQQMLREEALNDVKSGKMNILVATGVAARGLDIKNVSHVINFDLPKSIDEYVHRIGRTGRVGNKGLASSFYGSKEDAALAPALVKILTQTQQEIPYFLQTAEACDNWARPSSTFTGKDIRKRRGRFSRTTEDEAPLETAPTFEEEVW